MSAITGAVGAKLGGMAAGTFGWTAATWSQIGWTAGVLVGTYLFAPDGPDVVSEGPRLNDLKVTSSAYGVDIAKVFGAYRISGNIIWALPLQETRHEETQDEGKGGGGGSSSTIWYTYSATFAIALCEGPISGIRKIWFGSILIYDNGLFGKGINSSNITIYDGTEDQHIDWRIQSDKPDTPAYRNVAYIVFNTVQLEDYGNLIPNVTCEVIKNGDPTIVQLSDILTPSMSSANIHHIDDEYVYTVGGYYDNNYSNVNYRFYRSPISNGFDTKLLGETYHKNVVCNEGSGDEYTCAINTAVLHSPPFPMYSDSKDSALMLISGTTYQQLNNNMSCCDNIPGVLDYFPIGITDANYNFIIYDTDIYYYDFNNDVIGKNDAIEVSARTSQNSASQNLSQISVFNDVLYLVTLRPSEIEITTYDLLLVEIENKIIQRGFTNVNEANYLGITIVDVEGVHIFRDTGYDRLSITLEYIEYRNGLPSIKNSSANIANYKNGMLYKLTNTTYGSIQGTFNSTIERYSLNGISNNGIFLSSIVEELLLECGLASSDFDVTEGDSTSVIGYIVPRNISPRAAIEPLLSAYEFALVELDHKIILRKQNQDSILTVYEDDLGANSDNNLERNIRQELDLMKSLSIRYANADSDYQTSIQQIRRIDVKAENETIVELPLALTDTEAKQLAEKMMYRDWEARKTFKFSLPFVYSDLIAGDVVTLSLYNSIIQVKLTRITITEDNKLMCDAIANYQSSFISNAIGSDTGSNAGELIEIVGPTDFYILDVPTLSNQYLYDEGVYVAATGYSNSWSGCTVYSKTLNTDDFLVDLVLLGTPVPIGVVASILADGPTTIWDLTNYVDVISNIDLTVYSTTTEGVLLGNNYIIIGNEILQFQTATDISVLPTDNKYRLSGLLRGRRGTEYTTNFHVANEIFVYLSYSYTFGFIPKAISNTSEYNAISLNSYEISDTQELTNTGKNLKPFNVSYLNAQVDGTGVQIDWHRRSRYISGHMTKLPLSQSTELYTISINDNIHTSTTDSFTYTAALMTLDGYTITDQLIILVRQEGDHGSGDYESFTLN